MSVEWSFDPLSALGSVFGSVMAYKGQSEANQMNARLADENRMFQRTNMKHAIRWRTEDLKRAGLNPILAITGGLSGGSASGAMANFQNPARAMEGLGQGLLGSSKVGIEREIAKEQIKNIKADTAKKGAEKSLTWQLRDEAEARATITSANALYREMEKKVEKMPGVRHIMPWASTIMKRIGGSLISSALGHVGK